MHISLDSALGQQRRLNQVGETISSIAAPTAAYSLRSITGGDPKAVRVRRDTDNAEQDFTASGVSSGALTSFTNEDYVKYTSDFSSGDNSWGSLDDVTETGNIDGIGGLDNNLRLAIGSATSQHRAFRNGILPVNQKINFSARVFIPSTNSVVDSFRIADASGTVIITPTTPAQDQWVTVTASNVTPTNSSGQLRLFLQDGGTNSFTGNGFDVIYVREIVVTQVTSDGFVETWYDQSGNGNDAVQATAGNQPKIVDAGSLLTAGVTFDGGDSLSVSSEPVITASSSGVYSAFSVQTVATSEDGYLYGNASTSNGTSLYAAANTFTLSNKTSFLDNIPRSSGQNLLSAVYNNGDAGLLVNGAGTMTDTGTYDFSAGSSDFIIGNRNGGSAGATFLTGSINEIIVYNSNQTSNRTALETEIISHYGIS